MLQINTNRFNYIIKIYEAQKLKTERVMQIAKPLVSRADVAMYVAVTKWAHCIRIRKLCIRIRNPFSLQMSKN